MPVLDEVAGGVRLAVARRAPPALGWPRAGGGGAVVVMGTSCRRLPAARAGPVPGTTAGSRLWTRPGAARAGRRRRPARATDRPVERRGGSRHSPALVEETVPGRP